MTELLQDFVPRTPEVVHQRIITQLAQELNVRPQQIQVTVALLQEGATVPFIARYRKEVTGGLDDTVLRELEVRHIYLKELEERRDSILASVAQQEKLTVTLAKELDAADSKQRLEDLYAPYKPKRRTRAQIAREAGLEPLAQTLLTDHTAQPETLAASYVDADKGVADIKAALQGARDILVEDFAQDANLVSQIRDSLEKYGLLVSRVIKGKEQEGANFQDWFDFEEPIRSIPSHRVLAMFRGRQQGVLDIRIALPADQQEQTPHPYVAKVAAHFKLPSGIFSAQANDRERWLAEVCQWTWRIKLATQFELELVSKLREQAESEAIRVFAANLKDLLLAPPAGAKAILGLDPGIRTGVKVAAIDSTGKVLQTATIFPFEPRRDVQGSLRTLEQMVRTHNISLIAIGNGTASRETERLVTQLRKQMSDFPVAHVVISEAGASVYSASALAAEEFPDLDVSLRGAVSIARRLQDPLAELVKIEPKAIGVGQYQHDVNQRELSRSLDVVIEDCVNAVGVDVNTASAALLRQVSGLNNTLARNIVAYRDEQGAFQNRKSLLKVPRFGEKTFEQAAGFLRITDGDNPLDASAVHPEAYPVVKKILDEIQANIRDVMGNQAALKNVAPSKFVDERFGLPTITDILSELEKPGRDPRPEFTTTQFEEGVESLNDLKVGMILEGVVTNVANFGAFVNVGVDQDGLVHISELSQQFVKDPRDVVRTGQTIKVRVLEVDLQRKRVALSMRLEGDAGSSAGSPNRNHRGSTPKNKRSSQPTRESTGNNAMAAAFAKLKSK
ncbi:Tex family protein [Orrella sp. 11846]|uniref:Tex family protein n=1 Tax=Orrella sp. 11846 TaxID=3409913 RepID=UPI003B5B0A9E